jgi:hypothetical protein
MLSDGANWSVHVWVVALHLCESYLEIISRIRSSRLEARRLVDFKQLMQAASEILPPHFVQTCFIILQIILLPRLKRKMRPCTGTAHG